jgi:hypothetical protein
MEMVAIADNDRRNPPKSLREKRGEPVVTATCKHNTIGSALFQTIITPSNRQHRTCVPSDPNNPTSICRRCRDLRLNCSYTYPSGLANSTRQQLIDLNLNLQRQFNQPRLPVIPDGQQERTDLRNELTTVNLPAWTQQVMAMNAESRAVLSQILNTQVAAFNLATSIVNTAPGINLSSITSSNTITTNASTGNASNNNSNANGEEDDDVEMESN